VRLTWSRLALPDFEDATDWIARDNPNVAQQVAQRILDATQHIGHPGDDPDQREWLVQRMPYRLIYEIHGDTVTSARVWHMRRER
jgi:toxin ParE1/3/4